MQTDNPQSTAQPPQPGSYAEYELLTNESGRLRERILPLQQRHDAFTYAEAKLPALWSLIEWLAAGAPHNEATPPAGAAT